MKDVEDAQLVELAKLGDQDGFSELVRRYGEAVKGYCYYRTGDFEEARDLCQEAFVLAYTKLHQLQENSKFGAWIRRIAANVCTRWLERRKETPVEQVPAAVPPAESPTALLVREALRGLPDNERLAVVMYYVDGLSYGEIAEFLEISKATVRGRLYRGRELIKKEVITMTREAFEEQALKEDFAVRTLSLTRSFTRLGLGWSPNGKHILFLRYFEGKDVQLWISDTDGADARPISEIGRQEDYGWSPDSRRIVYGYARGHKDDIPDSLYIHELEQNQSREIASGFVWDAFWGMDALTGWQKPVWANDSRQFAMFILRRPLESRFVQTVVFDADTGMRASLTPSHINTGTMWPGAWSSDGALFALTSVEPGGSNYRLWVCNPDGGNLHPITDDSWSVESDPRYRPNKDEIAFSMSHGRSEDEIKQHYLDLWLIKPDGSNPRRLTNGSSPVAKKRMSFRYPEWTADGRYLVCLTSRADDVSHDREGVHEDGCDGIHLVDADTGEVIKVLESEPDSNQHYIGFRNKISICPNGKRIAFSVARYTVDDRRAKVPNYTDRHDFLYYYDIPTRTLHEVQHTQPEQDGVLIFACGYNWMPLWSPDGKRILFTKARIANMDDWRKEPPAEGRLQYFLGSMFDRLEPCYGDEHLCFLEIGGS